MIFRAAWARYRSFSAGSGGRRWQRGQAISDYWPILVGVAVLALLFLALWLTPGVSDLYRKAVDAVFGAQAPKEQTCVPQSEGTYPNVTLAGQHRIELAGWVEAGGNTTIAYRVTSQATGSGPAISHWVLVLPDCLMDASSVLSASEAYEFVNPDPTTGARGVKFDTGYKDYETRVVYITFRGRLSKVTGSVVVKAAHQVSSGSIQAPGCPTPNECP